MASLARSAAVAPGAAGLLTGQAVHIAAFAVATAVCPGLVWPVTLHHIRRPPPLRTGTSALIGRNAVAGQDVSASGGRVSIGGQERSSCSCDGNLVIPAGTTVDVIEIGGAMALIYPRE